MLKDIIHYSPWLTVLVFILAFFLILMGIVVSHDARQTTAEEAQCRSVGGEYGGGKCYVNGQLYDFKESE